MAASASTGPGERDFMNLTAEERTTIQHVERLGASISLVGVCLIFVAYGLFKRVRTVPNTFIFFASIANVGASVACLIGYAGILAGESSALCQAQGFLLEMLMQSDPWWSLAMAINVYLVFFTSYPLTDFHRHLWIYCLVCFGIPATPALVCLFYAPDGKKIYGNATLWCWIDDSYNQLRIFTYYLPIWACISLSVIIYVAVGYRVFHQRNQLRNLTLSNQAKGAEDAEGRSSGEKGRQQSYGTVTTEVRVTAESSGSQTPPSTPEGSIAPVLQKPPATAAAHAPWCPPGFDVEHVSPTASAHASNKPFTSISSVSSTTRPQRDHGRRRKKTRGLRRLPRALARTWRKFASKLANLDPIKLAYLRTSFVFAVSILVTWTPSSINRVYSLVHPTRTSYGLNLASAVVLPLQGLWNAIIFAATSWNILREEVRTLGRGRWSGLRSSRRFDVGGGGGGDDEYHHGRAPPPSFRGRHQSGSGLEGRELPTIRVIRGGSL